MLKKNEAAVRSNKIVHLITDLKIGGEAMVLLSILPRLNKMGFENIICCLSSNLHQDSMEEIDLIAQFIRKGIKVINLEIKSKNEYKVIFRLIRALRRERPFILHTYLFHPNIMGRIIGRLFKIPIIISSVVSVDDWKKWYHCLLEKITSYLANMIIVNSEAVKLRLIRRDKIAVDKIKVLYHGVNINKFDLRTADSKKFRKELHLSDDTFIIGTVCRLHEVKGIEYLLKAYSIISKQIEDSLLIIVGDGPKKKDLEDYSMQMGISPNVIFLGSRHDIPDILATFSIFVISSLWEGIPNTVFEAMAMKVPIVSTDVGGISEILENGITGYLVNPCDSSSMAESILNVYNNTESALEVSNKAYEMVSKNYTLEKSFHKKIYIYRSLLSD